MNLRLEGETEKRNNWSPLSLLLNVAERERRSPFLARNRDVIQLPEDSPEMPFLRPTLGYVTSFFIPVAFFKNRYGKVHPYIGLNSNLEVRANILARGCVTLVN